MRELKFYANYIVREISSYFYYFVENLVLKFSMRPWQCIETYSKLLRPDKITCLTFIEEDLFIP